MSHEIKVSRFYTIPVHELFGYFIDPNLLERWCYPEGMNLKVAHFDARVGGKYHFEHTTPKETYVCDGHIRKIIQNELLRMVDDVIMGPDGKILEEKIACDVKFSGFGTTSGVEITQSGFKSAESAKDCEKGWNDCLSNLQELVKDSGLRRFGEGDVYQGLVQT